MSNLIPTPRTDKNGVTSIRHMKPVASPMPVRSALPTVGAQVEQIALRNFMVKHFQSIGWSRVDETKELVGIMQKHDPELISLLKRCVTGGAEEAQRHINVHISGVMHILLAALERTKRTSSKRWIDESSHELLPSLRTEIGRRWNGINVAEEYGYVHPDRDEYFTWIKSTQILMESNWLDVDLPKDDHYWRGVSALTLVQLVNDKEISFQAPKELVAQVPGFVEYAGQHHDIKSVLDIAVNRNLIDAHALREIIETDGSPSLREGAL